MEEVYIELLRSLGLPAVIVGVFVWDKIKSVNKLMEIVQQNTVAISNLEAFLRKYGYGK